MGGDRHAYIAGLGAASILPAIPTTDIDRAFHGAAPELIDPERWGLADAGATMASDVYAFGVLTWEVGNQIHGFGKRLNGMRFVARFSPEGSRFRMKSSSRGFIQC